MNRNSNSTSGAAILLLDPRDDYHENNNKEQGLPLFLIDLMPKQKNMSIVVSE